MEELLYLWHQMIVTTNYCCFNPSEAYAASITLEISVTLELYQFNVRLHKKEPLE